MVILIAQGRVLEIAFFSSSFSLFIDVCSGLEFHNPMKWPYSPEADICWLVEMVEMVDLPTEDDPRSEYNEDDSDFSQAGSDDGNPWIGPDLELGSSSPNLSPAA